MCCGFLDSSFCIVFVVARRTCRQAMCSGRLAKGVDESFNRCARTCEFGARAVRSATHQRSERAPRSGNRRPAWSDRLASRRSRRLMCACTEGAQERSFLSGSVTMHIIEQSGECCPLCQRLAHEKKPSNAGLTAREFAGHELAERVILEWTAGRPVQVELAQLGVPR